MPSQSMVNISSQFSTQYVLFFLTFPPHCEHTLAFFRGSGQGRNGACRALRLGTRFLVHQYLWQRFFQLLQIVAQRAGGHPSFTCRLFNIDLLERRSDGLDFFVHLPYSICHGLHPGETLGVATTRFYQKQPMFVKAQPTNISDISQLSEPSRNYLYPDNGR